MAMAIPPPLAGALVVKRMTVRNNPSGESTPTTSTTIFLSPTVARFEGDKGSSFDARLVDLESRTSTFLFFEKKLAGVMPMQATADWLLERMKGRSFNVELRPTQRTREFGPRTCREHSARVAVSVDHTVKTVTIAPGLAPQWSSRLKPEWQWVLEGKVWLASAAEPNRYDVSFRKELESRVLTLQVPEPQHPEWWLQGLVANRLRAAAARRGDLCAETLTYTPPEWGTRMLLRLGPERPEALLPDSWSTETLTIEESKVSDDQFVVPPGFRVLPIEFGVR